MESSSSSSAPTNVASPLPNNTTESTSGRSLETPVRLGTNLTNHEMGLLDTPDVHTFKNLVDEVNEDGYDSDGLQGPFFDQVEGVVDCPEDEDEFVGESEVVNDRGDQLDQGSDSPPSYATFTDDEIKKMKVKELKLYLKDNYNIVLKGGALKAEYVAKLSELVQNKVPFCTHRDSIEVENMAVGSIFNPTAYWKELQPGEEVNDDGLVVDGETFYEPTGEEGVSIRVKKRNYSHTFD